MDGHKKHGPGWIDVMPTNGWLDNMDEMKVMYGGMHA